MNFDESKIKVSLTIGAIGAIVTATVFAVIFYIDMRDLRREFDLHKLNVDEFILTEKPREEDLRVKVDDRIDRKCLQNKELIQIIFDRNRELEKRLREIEYKIYD
jgi:hypothetical protein